MTRIKRGNVARKRRQKTLKLSSGFKGSPGTLFRVANQHALKAQKNASRDRIQRKRLFRGIWITRINAAIRSKGLSYSQFIHLTKQSNILLNRKVISQLALLDKEAFTQLLFSVH